MIKFILIFLFTFCTVLSGHVQLSFAEEVATAKISSNKISFEKIDVSDVEKGKVYQEIKYTKINFSVNEQLERTIYNLDKQFMNNALRFKRENKKEIRLVCGERNDGIYYYHQKATLVRNDDRYISFREDCDIYLMGAHGSHLVQGHNFDVATGKKLTVFDVVTSKEDLRNDILQQLKSGHYYLFDEYKDTIEKYMDGSIELCFLIDREGVSIYFQQYDVAPYAAGIIELKLDKSILRFAK